MNTLLQLQLFCEFVIFLAIVFMNVAKKNTTLITAYLLQSTFLVFLLSLQAYQESSLRLFLVVMAMFVIKVFIAPRLFWRFIKRSHLNISASTYLNIPMTLGTLILLTLFAQSDVFLPFLGFLPHAVQVRMFLIGSVFLSFFLTINRKGALSQIIGVLSLENCVFAFGNFLGVKQAVSLELGILFDVLFWVIISGTFIAMIYRHYGTLDLTELRQLRK